MKKQDLKNIVREELTSFLVEKAYTRLDALVNRVQQDFAESPQLKSYWSRLTPNGKVVFLTRAFKSQYKLNDSEFREVAKRIDGMNEAVASQWKKDREEIAVKISTKSIKDLDIRKVADERATVPNGTVFRYGRAIQVWWEKDSIGRPVPKHRAKETWIANNEGEAKKSFRTLVDRWSEVNEAVGNVFQFTQLFSQIRKDPNDLRSLAQLRPTEQIKWLEKNYALRPHEAQKMRRHLQAYIEDAKNQIPVESIYEAYGDDDEMRWDYKSGKIPKEVKDLVEKYAKNDAAAIKVLSPRGTGSGLKSNKPKDGIWAYVWRMARFHSGDDPKMPITATWDLSDEIEKQTGWDVSFAITNAESKALLKKLDDLVDRVLPKLGKDPMGAARRWKGLI